MSFSLPTFASTMDAINNRAKARAEGFAPQGYLTDYEWNQLGQKLAANNEDIKARAKQEQDANLQAAGGDPFANFAKLGQSDMARLRGAPASGNGFGTGSPAQPRVIGGTPRGANAIGGNTWAPGSIPVSNGKGGTDMTFGRPASWGGTHDDGYRIGAGSGDGKFHDTFGTGIDDIKAHGPMASMGRDLAAGRANPNDPYDPKNKPTQGFGGRPMAHGGPTTLPKPKPDDIPAALGEDEYVFDRPTVMFHGLKTLRKLQEQAHEGLKEMPFGKPAGNPTGYAEGGATTNPAYEHFLALKKEYRDPLKQYDREKEAAAAARPDFIDAGGGYGALKPNRFGTGFVTPPVEGSDAPGVFVDKGEQFTMGKGQVKVPQGWVEDWKLKPVPDIVPSSAMRTFSGAMPDDPTARREINRGTFDQIMKDAPARLAADDNARAAAWGYSPPDSNLTTDQLDVNGQTRMPLLATTRERMAREQAGQPGFGVPSASSPRPFLAPWEKDAIAADARVESDRMQGRPDGVRETDWRRFKATPQGIQFAALLAQQHAKPPANQALPVIMPDGSVSKDHYMVNGMTLPFGRDTHKTDSKLVDTLTRTIQDKGLDLAKREQARRTLSSHLGVEVPMPSASKPKFRVYNEHGHQLDLDGDPKDYNLTGWTLGPQRKDAAAKSTSAKAFFSKPQK